MVPLAMADTPLDRKQIAAVIYTDLWNELERAEALVPSDRLALNSTDDAPPCYSAPFSALRQEQPIVPSQHGPADDLIYRLARINLAAQHLANMASEMRSLESAIGPIEASLLRACITASPFASHCLRAVSKMARETGRSPQLSQAGDNDLEIPVLTPVEPPTDNQLYCATMPLIIP